MEGLHDPCVRGHLAAPRHGALLLCPRLFLRARKSEFLDDQPQHLERGGVHIGHEELADSDARLFLILGKVHPGLACHCANINNGLRFFLAAEGFPIFLELLGGSGHSWGDVAIATFSACDGFVLVGNVL